MGREARTVGYSEPAAAAAMKCRGDFSGYRAAYTRAHNDIVIIHTETARRSSIVSVCHVYVFIFTRSYDEYYAYDNIITIKR